ncbi:MAG: CinA family nicotinamide mononucleotide deamidase-related protein [Phycisphaerae bacterium]|nr:CinA family nicotinamide mononucleotide deamidase-related protein [Phycisphaerae bacterium]
MNIAVLSIGDELLGGRILDTNAAWISGEVARTGGRVSQRGTVGDERSCIAEAVNRLSGVADVLVTTGGLGPTTDDLTRFAAADLIDGGVVIDDADAIAVVQAWCERVGLPPSEARAMVAKRPPSADFLSNDQGTAPGLRFVLNDCVVWMLPGPPSEMRSMFTRHVAASLCAGGSSRAIEVRASGLTEVQAADLLGDRLDRSRSPQLGIRVGRGLIRVTAQDLAGDCMQDAIDSAAADVQAVLEPWSLPVGCSSLADAVAYALRGVQWTCATAESCTGGGIGAALTDVPGSSDWFVGGFITYSNALKSSLLGVPVALLGENGPGAVSAEVVEAMARGARDRSGADIAVAVSGVAGPDGGSPEKPVGTVWIGISDAAGTTSRRIRVPGDRPFVRRGTIQVAMQWLRWRVDGVDEALQWEQPS